MELYRLLGAVELYRWSSIETKNLQWNIHLGAVEGVVLGDAPVRQQAPHDFAKKRLVIAVSGGSICVRRLSFALALPSIDEVGHVRQCGAWP